MSSTFNIVVAGKPIVIETHDRPVHLEELTGAVLVEMFANSAFIQKYASNGRIIIGTKNSSFDEHLLNLSKTQSDKFCAADLVALALDIFANKGVNRWLDFVRRNDVSGTGQWGDLNHAAKVVDQYGPGMDSAQRVYDAFKPFIWAYIAAQMDFHGQADAEFAKHAMIVTVRGGKRALKIISVESENNQMLPLALKKGADAVIIRHPDCHTPVILVKKTIPGFKEIATDIYRMLCLEELKTAGRSELVTDWKEFDGDGSHPMVPEWYLNSEAGQILNGGRSHKSDVPATKLDLLTIVGIVKIAFAVLPCGNGPCVSTKKQSCPLYCRGLKRCRRIRATAMADAAKKQTKK